MKIVTASDLVFLDVETLGLDVRAPIWELAAVRRSVTGDEARLRLFIEHEPQPWSDTFPEPFLSDYRARFDADAAVDAAAATEALMRLSRGTPTLVGANPSFDAERISRQWLEPRGLPRPWHYHLMDIENVVVGHLAATGGLPCGPWKSDQLSRLVGVDPAMFPRHTAMGDVSWVIAQWDRVFGEPPAATAAGLAR